MTDAIPQVEGKGLARSPGALAGIKVVDLTRVLGGPYCTMILSDHGAEVIKIEPPQGDEVRDWGPPFHDREASYFIGVNRNKRSLALDLGKPEGRQVLLRLLEEADVLIENYKPGAMEKWGIGYAEVLSKRFPQLIHCRVSGFGPDGPLGALPGYDAVIQAMVGLMSINGNADTGPLRMGTPIVDLATGLYSCIAILMALNILRTGAHLMRQAFDGLMDSPMTVAERAVVESVLDSYRLRGIQFHALRTRQAGARRFLSVHVLVPGGWTVKRGHDLLEQLEHEVRAVVPNTNVLTHLEPIGDPAALEDVGLDRG